MEEKYFSLTKEQKISNLKLTEKNLLNKISNLQKQLEGVQEKLRKLSSPNSGQQ